MDLRIHSNLGRAFLERRVKRYENSKRELNPECCIQGVPQQTCEFFEGPKTDLFSFRSFFYHLVISLNKNTHELRVSS